jgi:hypothetical protein
LERIEPGILYESAIGWLYIGADDAGGKGAEEDERAIVKDRAVCST